jgi:predicted TIM-barrel fold metal-dependent hydrolase
VAHIVVDCHSHIFNAEDIPINGFLKKRVPLPALLTGVFSGPLDYVASRRAPGSEEATRLVKLIRAAVEGPSAAGLEDLPGAVGLEDVGGFPGAEPSAADDVISDEELDRRLVQYLALERPDPGPGQPGGTGLEGMGDAEDAIERLVADASPEQLAELDEWLLEWGTAQATVVIPDAEAALEGIFDDARQKAAILRRAARRFRDALRLITQPRYLVMSALARTYSEVRLFVPALVDFDRTARDEPSTPVGEQIALHSLVSKLSVVGGIPGAPEARVHPFVAFCPYREVEASELASWRIDAGVANPYVPYGDVTAKAPQDRFTPSLRFDPDRARSLMKPAGPWTSAKLDLTGVTRSLDLVRHAIELGGFTGVKLYPPSGFLPTGNVFRFGERRGVPLDVALSALYRYCEDMEVPILTHASHSNGFEAGYDDFASPSGWEQVLRQYPKLRLCFGHFGHLYGVQQGEDVPRANSWPMRYLTLMDTYEYVYADVGCSKYGFDAAYRDRFDAFLRVILGPMEGADARHHKRRRRIMFGSDYWMNTLDPDHTKALTRFTAGVQRQFGDEVLAFFQGGNALRWLGMTDDLDRIDLASKSRARLVSFYGDQPLPEWLAS